MNRSWLLLIYTVPPHPSRLRALVWREVKKAGALYLRDGVCVLPEREGPLATFQGIAAKVRSFGGQATVARSVQVEAEQALALISQSRAACGAEYAEMADEAERFLAHLLSEVAHRDLGSGETRRLTADMGKLGRWLDQARARDYFGAEGADRVEALLARCRQQLAAVSPDGQTSAARTI